MASPDGGDAGHDDRLEEAVADWWDRRARGEADATEAVLRAFPDLADSLRTTLSALGDADLALTLTREAGGATPPFSDFRIVREIGRGGMGVVFEAEQHSMRRVVALKVLHPAVVLEPKAVERFRREAQAAGRVHHTNLVPVYAMGEDRGRWYYAMELVRGRTLAEVIRDLRDLRAGPPGTHTPTFPTGGANGSGSVPAARDFYARAALAFAGVADALRAAHQAGVVHRDVKPGNLILAEDGTLKLMDFGLARAGDGAPSITTTGATLGTPAYMSPEQVRGAPHPLDGRTDVWSLGATLYELLTLRAPFLGSAAQIFQKVLTQDPPSPRSLNRRIPRDLETIVLRALEKDPERRYSSAADLARDLSGFAQGERIHARRLGLAARAWRRIRRRPALSLAAAGLLLALPAAIYLGLEAQREGRARRRAEYDLLLRRAVDATPRSAASSQAWGRNEAVRFYDEAVGLDPDRPEAYVARALDGARSVDERLRDAGAAAARGLAPPTAALLREVVRMEGGQAENDDEVRRLVAGLGPAPEALARFLAGSVAARRGDHEEAERRFAEILAESAQPSLLAVLARTRRITIRIQKSQFAGALDDVHALAGMGALSVRGAGTEAWLWRRLGKEAEAEARFTSVLDRALQSEGETFELADAFVSLPAHDWLDRTTERGVAAYATSGRLWALRATALDQDSRFGPAKEAWDHAKDLRPDDAYVVVRRAQTLANLDRRDEALAEAARAVTLDPHDPRLHLDQADVCRRFGQVTAGVAAAERALQLDGRSIGALRLLGMFKLGAGQKAAAEAFFARALKVSPSDGQTLYWLGKLRRSQEDLPGALDAFERSIAADPDVPERHQRRGEILRELERNPDAEWEFRRALSLRPDYAEALFGLGELLCATDRREEGVARLRAAVARDPKDADAWVEIGNALRAPPLDVPGAIDAYQKALVVRPGMWEAQANLAAILLEAGNAADALPLLAACVQASPDNAQLRCEQGVAFTRLGQVDQALAAFRETLVREPGYVRARIEIARIHLAAGKPREAAEELERAASTAPGSSEIQHDLALARWRAKDLVGAEAAARRATELDGASVEAHSLWSGILHARGDSSGSAREAERARTLAPDRLDLWMEAAAARIDAGEPGAAADLYVQAAERFPKDAKAQYLAAWMLTTAEDPVVRAPAKAVELARRAVYLDSAAGKYKMALGAALYREERFAEAVQHLEAALAAGGPEAETAYFLAMALQRDKKPAEARVAFDRAVAARKASSPTDRECVRFEAEAMTVLGLR